MIKLGIAAQRYNLEGRRPMISPDHRSRKEREVNMTEIDEVDETNRARDGRDSRTSRSRKQSTEFSEKFLMPSTHFFCRLLNPL